MEESHLKRRRRGSALPIYAFIVIWLLCSLAVPLYTIWGILAAAAVSLGAGILIGSLITSKRRKEDAAAAAAAPAEPEKAPESNLSPEVEEINSDGRKAMKEMARLYSTIKDPGVRQRINELMMVSDKIIKDAEQDPSDVPQIRKFLNYYLPTTIKLLNAYDRMSDQVIVGDNISKSMQSIENMLDTAIEAYKKQLDSLFENQAMDIEADISVMNQMLAREGLTGGGELDDLISKAAREQARLDEEKKQAEAKRAELERQRKAAEQAQAEADEARERLAHAEKQQEYTSAEDAMKRAAKGSGSSAAAQASEGKTE